MTITFEDREAAERAILEHADALESGRLTWVSSAPIHHGEACVAYASEVGEPYALFDNVAYDAIDLEANHRGHRSVVYWNDGDCGGASDAADFLRHAAKRVWTL